MDAPRFVYESRVYENSLKSSKIFKTSSDSPKTSMRLESGITSNIFGDAITTAVAMLLNLFFSCTWRNPHGHSAAANNG